MLDKLVAYYEYLRERHPEKVAAPGWSSTRVTAFLNLDADGNLVGIVPAPEARGVVRSVPRQVERSSGVAANLLCDGSSYLLGIDEKGKPERAVRCFEAAKALHEEALADCSSQAGEAVKKFFEKWNPAEALAHEVVLAQKEVVLGSGNLAFTVGLKEVLQDNEIGEMVRSRAFDADDTTSMVSLVSGDERPVARLHPKIKGLPGAQSSGAVLVGFNAPSFTSYGRDEDQGLNAPVSDYEAFAYTTALNYLIADPAHHVRIGDTTIVFWALEHDDECAWAFDAAMDPDSALLPPWEMDEGISDSGGSTADAKKDEESSAQLLAAVMERVRAGKKVHEADLDTPFFVLGLSPNAARVSVRFFYESTFGALLSNLDRHYQRLQIAHRAPGPVYLSPRRLVRETENPNTRQSSEGNRLVGALMRAILSDGRYPQALYQGALARIRSTQDNEDKGILKVDLGRAAIIRACLIRNYGISDKELTVDLNEERGSVPYCLGRLFAVLERIQWKAARLDGRNINSTIVDRYFNSACATPAYVFPAIEKLSMSHLGKLRKSDKGGYEERLMESISERICATSPRYPGRLNIEEQGDFILGYWCQRAAFRGTNAKSDKADLMEKEN